MVWRLTRVRILDTLEPFPMKPQTGFCCTSPGRRFWRCRWGLPPCDLRQMVSVWRSSKGECSPWSPGFSPGTSFLPHHLGLVIIYFYFNFFFVNYQYVIGNFMNTTYYRWINPIRTFNWQLYYNRSFWGWGKSNKGRSVMTICDN